MATAAGLGADVLALTQRVESMQPAGDVSVYALPYAQAPAVLGTPISVLRDLQPGADLLAAYLQRRVARCPGEAQIVIGQSEGAAVVHLAWAGIARYVSAAVLFGDPLHVGWTSYDQPGSDTAQGQLAGWTGIGRPAWLFQVADPIPAGTAGRVRSYCLPDDRVCAFNLLDTRPDAHLTYRLNRSLVAGGPGVLTEALGFVDSSLMRRG